MGLVGSAIADAVEALGSAGDFEEDGAETVAELPVAGQAAGDLSQQMGGQVRQVGPGQDEVFGVVDEQGRLRLRVAGSRPMKSSRGLVFQAAARSADRPQGSQLRGPAAGRRSRRGPAGRRRSSARD